MSTTKVPSLTLKKIDASSVLIITSHPIPHILPQTNAIHSLLTHFHSAQFADQALQSLRQTCVGVVAIFVGIEEIINCFVVTDKLFDCSQQWSDLLSRLLESDPFRDGGQEAEISEKN